jgi:hypothetical protein
MCFIARLIARPFMSWSDTTPAPNAKAAAMHLTADNHHAENSDHRDYAAADARLRAAIPATTATETARPMVPGGLDGEWELLRARLRQGAGRYSQERLVSDRLARERQLLHTLKVRICEHPSIIGTFK